MYVGEVSVSVLIAIPILLIVLIDMASLLPTNRKISAILICKIIPGACPFARHVDIGRLQFNIPPLCKLNPWYENSIATRFKALNFLAEHQQQFNINIEQFY
jgi:Mo-dependent nitrogenase C-terminus